MREDLSFSGVNTPKPPTHSSEKRHTPPTAVGIATNELLDASSPGAIALRWRSFSNPYRLAESDRLSRFVSVRPAGL